MLDELYISNFALIDSITINFNKGLNIFTGATGVGKSVIMGALNFLLGSRVTSDIIRSNKKEANVSGVFIVKNDSLVKELEILLDDFIDEELIIQRSLDGSGRNRCKINNQPVTVSILKKIGECLVNIHGQHEHESLIEPANQLSILDYFSDANDLRIRFSEIYKKALEKEKYLSLLKENESLRKREIDLYSFEIKEIENANLKPGEFEKLEEEQKVLANAEKIQNTVSSCFDNLYERDNSVIGQLKDVRDELEHISVFENNFNELVEGCNQSIYQLEEVSITLQKAAEKFDINPERLAEIDDRLESIRNLNNKYGETIEDVLDHCNKLKIKLGNLVKENKDFESTENKLTTLKSELLKTGNKLTKIRKKTAEKLSKLIKNELGDLGINNAQFQVNILDSKINTNEHQIRLDNISSAGFESIEFMFSSNLGENVKPLRKIASGGEISRVMLALKGQLAIADNTPLLVFDEIDANIGGRMGKIVGEKLKTVSKNHQIICITHLPQIASYADQHFKVNKIANNHRTITEIEKLSEEKQLEEIADMIRGEEKNDVTLKQAKEMISDAKKFSSSKQ